MTKVSITKCDSYAQEEVNRALKECLAHLGGIQQFVKPGQKVLIKPNILLSRSPDEAVTTHPAIVSAVVKEVVKSGGIAWVGDSPGNAYANVSKTIETTGIGRATEEAGGKIVYFQQEGVVEVKGIKISKVVFDADVIINLPKLKTHELTLYTGAIKNMFGVIPGFYKAQFHFESPRLKIFSGRLVDIFETAKPNLNIMDAVVGMEGNGPSSGTPRKLGAIIISTDAVAIDAVSSYLIGFDPQEIDTNVIAHQRQIGEIDLKKIEILGEKLENTRQKDWQRPGTKYLRLLNLMPKWSYNLLLPIIRQLKITPVVDQEKCTRCLICVKSCPAKTIAYNKEKKRVEIDIKKCIYCFCCHELCEYRAIKLKGSWLAKILGLG